MIEHKPRKIAKGNRPVKGDGTSKRAKPIIQYSQDGTEIARYASARIASNAISTETKVRCQENIHANLSGIQRSAYGFVWKYEEEVY